MEEIRFLLVGSYISLSTRRTGWLMSALSHKWTFSEVCVMSALPSRADIAERDRHVL